MDWVACKVRVHQLVAIVNLGWVQVFVGVADDGGAELFDGCQEVLLCALTQPDHWPTVLLDLLGSLLVEID